MLVNHIPFTDLALGFPVLNLPFELYDWETHLENYFSKVEAQKKLPVKIDDQLFESYKLTLEYPSTLRISYMDSPANDISITSLLISTLDFYLLVNTGDNPAISSFGANFIENGASEYYQKFSGGRFQAITNGVMLSYEEDETGNFFILATSNQRLLNDDAVFNTSKGIILEYF